MGGFLLVEKKSNSRNAPPKTCGHLGDYTFNYYLRCTLLSLLQLCYLGNLHTLDNLCYNCYLRCNILNRRRL